MRLTCSEGGKAGAVNGEAVHRLATAATCAASCGGAQDQTAPSAASCILNSTQSLATCVSNVINAAATDCCCSLLRSSMYVHGEQHWMAGG